MNKVFSFKNAIEAGYNPKYYKYGKDLPLGDYMVTLNFKIWANQNTMAVTCFCRIKDSGELIRFNVFRNKDKKYLLKDTDLDIVEMHYKTEFNISISANSKGNRIVSGLPK